MLGRLFANAAVFAVSAASIVFSTSAGAAILLYGASLTGSQEVPGNASAGTGSGTVSLDDVANTITVNENWTNLAGNASASHIHTGAVGVSGPVTFGFTGVPSASAGSIPQQVFSVTAAQISALQAGNMYFNVHSSAFSGGEIRGQIAAVPEPASLGLIGMGAITLLARRRRLMNCPA